MSRLQRLREHAARHGLHVRGVVAARDEDALPLLAGGLPARALALVGNVGSSFWPAFSASPESCDGRNDPLDRWSRRVGEEAAQRCGGLALFPFGGPPHYPFQRWASRTGRLFASPVGLLVDPEYGLWHAFRFAIALPCAADAATPAAASPCTSCRTRPCLSACPVTAFVEGEYRMRRCVDHLAGNADAQCWRIGCLARHACPVGRAQRYLTPHANFHMSAFVAKHR